MARKKVEFKMTRKTVKGLSIKDVRSQEVVQWQGGSSDVVVCTFWCKKIGFFKIYGMSARTRGG